MKSLDPAIQDKQNVLQELINGCVFAPSASALAKRLGYKGKTSIYRIQQGEASAGAIEEAWDKLRAFLQGTDEQLVYAARAVKNCRTLKRLVKEKGTEGTDIKERHLWVIQGVMLGDAERFPERFQREVWPDLMDLRTEDTDAFWMMMALYYFDEEGADAYAKNFDLLSVLTKFHEWLQQHYENCDRPRSSINNIIREEYIKAFSWGCTWDLMYYGALALLHYAEPDTLDRTARAYNLYNLGDDSYWIAPGTIYQEKARLWHLMEIQIGEGTHGLYYALEAEVGRNKEEFTVIQIIPLIFCESLGTMQMEVTKERKPITAPYEWNESHTELSINVTKEQQAAYGIPARLCRIDLDNPQGKDAKIWANVMRGYHANTPANVLAAVYAFEGMEYLNDYVVANVTIDRYTMNIAVEREGELTDYSISINQYPFLRTILPSDIVGVIRQTGTDELSFRWIDKGYVIPLKEFKKEDFKK